MSIFKKKNQNTETENTGLDIKHKVLNALNAKLQGTVYDDCIIMPKGFTVDIQVGRCEVKNDIHMVQVIYIIKNDELDEPIIDPVDSQGKTEDEAINMSVEIFFGGIWHPLNQAMTKKNPVHVSVNYLMQHYDFDMYAHSIVRIGAQHNRQPVMLINYIKAEIPKYLGSKKYYWVRIFLTKIRDRKIVEVRVNGTICGELSKLLMPYVDSWDENEQFICEKQYAIFVQREDDKCPFTKETVVKTAKKAIELMENINSQEDFTAMLSEIETLAGDKALAAEIRVFIPEILAKLTLGYHEGDSLFLLQDESSIEFKKTQLRSYFYIQQVILEYLQKRPEQERVMRIVTNSVAFREARKAKEAGHEPNELYVPGTSYKMNIENYKVW